MAGDDWGADPQVRYLRKVFTAIESAQTQFLKDVHISLFDDRLRRWRDAALRLFEKAWALSAARGLSRNEEEISNLYIHCLAYFLRLNRIEIPQELLLSGEKMSGLIKEALR